jgi:hypothetical protein
VAADLHVGTTLTLIGGSSGGASGSSGQPRTECYWPPPLYIVHATGGHQLANGWAPRSGRGQRARRAVGLVRDGDQPNRHDHREMVSRLCILLGGLAQTVQFYFIACNFLFQS